MLTLLTSLTLAAVPTELTLQGQLTSAAGQPVDGTYALTVSLYGGAAGGPALVSSSFPAVNVADGVFSLVLPGVDPALVASAPSLHLGVKIEGEPELPRQSVRPVATALVAVRALGLECSACVTASMLAPGAAVAPGPGLILLDGTLALDTSFTDARYVNTAGDAITGSLSVAGTLTAGTVMLPKAQYAALPPATPANAGQLAFASDRGRVVFSDGSRWVELGEMPPLVLSISPTQVPPNLGTKISIVGSGFAVGATVSFGATPAASVVILSPQQLEATVPGGLSSGLWDVTVTNPSGLKGTLPNGLAVDAAPGWITGATLAGITDFAGASIPLNATDPEGGPVSYILVSGALPPGLTFDAAAGLLSGDPVDVAAATNYTFTVGAVDDAPQPNVVERTFTITVSPAADGSTSARAGSSCAGIQGAGFSKGSAAYWLVPVTGPRFQVFCDMVTEGGGWLDLVRTMNLPGIDLAAYRDRFFITNNSFAITLGVGNATTTGEPGFYVINQHTSYSHVEGCHLKSVLPFSRVRLSYRMQGNDEGYRCNSANWIPLHGPGYEGGHAGYLSDCPAGYSCIQGTPTLDRDAPISATYSSEAVPANALLTFSGSGTGSAQTGNCARDPVIPVANPCTYFTRLLLR